MLSQLAWTSDSPLFDAIDAAGSVPPYKDVALPTVAGVGRVIGSPLLHPRVLKLGARIPESPLSALHDRHTSPGMSSARRALFSPGGSARKSPIPIAPKPPPQGGVTVQLLTNTFKMPLPQGGTQSPGRDPHKEPSIGGGSSLKGAIQSDTTSPQKMMATQTTPVKSSPLNLPGVTDLLASASTMLTPSCKRVLSPAGVHPLIPTSPPIPSVTITPSLATPTPSLTTPVKRQGMTPGSSSSTSQRPKRTGSLALFYRKAYQLAFIRIKDLCERLGQNTEFIQKLVI